MASPVYLCESLPGVQPHIHPRAAAPADPYRMIGAREARAMEPGDPAVMIGLVDSGVALAHPELARHLRPGVDTVELPADAVPSDMTLLSTSAVRQHRPPEDDQGHGTGCASIMAAEGLGMAPGLAGLSPVIPGKALAAVRQKGARKATALGSLPDIDHAVKLIVDLGARVLNLSFGTPATALAPDDPVPHVDVIRYALSRGCTLVAASGNQGDDVPYYPAALPGVIAVISVDGAGVPSDFGSWGPHVALAAPGEGVPMASIDGYTEGNGTSFAAPFVTATAALMIARALRQSTPLSAETVRRLLRASARPFSSGVDADGCGAGILDVPAALRAVDLECDLSPTPN
jgi:subtilisin family serine protease